MKQYTVTATQSVEITVIAPDDATISQIRKLASRDAEWIDGADSGWEVDVFQSWATVDASPEATTADHAGKPLPGPIADADFVLADDGKSLARAEAAKWWRTQTLPKPRGPVSVIDGVEWWCSPYAAVRADRFDLHDIAELTIAPSPSPSDLVLLMEHTGRGLTERFPIGYRPLLQLGRVFHACITANTNLPVGVVVDDAGVVVALVAPTLSDECLRVVDGWIVEAAP